MKKKLIIFGDSGFAEIAYLYFTEEGEYEVVAFCVEKEFLNKKKIFNLNIITFDQLSSIYSPIDHFFFAAVTYKKMNDLRSRISNSAKKMGYKLARYISPYSFIGPKTSIGEHCFIFENNVIQPFVTIKNNVIIWSGNHIGHHSTVYENCFISSHAVISGHCTIGPNSFIGVNATVSNNIDVGKYNWIGPSCTIMSNTEPDAMHFCKTTHKAKISSIKFFNR